MNRIDDDLKKIFKKAWTDELEVLSGRLKGKTLIGFFSNNYEMHKLDDKPLATSGPVFSCESVYVSKLLLDGDRVLFSGDEYVVKGKPKSDEKGFSVVELETKIVSTGGDDAEIQ